MILPLAHHRALVSLPVFAPAVVISSSSSSTTCASAGGGTRRIES